MSVKIKHLCIVGCILLGAQPAAAADMERVSVMLGTAAYVQKKCTWMSLDSVVFRAEMDAAGAKELSDAQILSEANAVTDALMSSHYILRTCTEIFKSMGANGTHIRGLFK